MKGAIPAGPSLPALGSVSRECGGGTNQPTLVGKSSHLVSTYCMLGPCLALSDPHDNKVTGCHSPHFIDKGNRLKRGQGLALSHCSSGAGSQDQPRSG